MNLLHLKYALEVENTGSFTKAATNLYMNQPHLSKSIRELEDTFSIRIFNRTSKGVIPTKKGKEFLFHAKKILEQINEIEQLYNPIDNEKIRFEISLPRASYISDAFIEFAKTIDKDKEIDINYRETNSIDAIKNVTEGENNLGIIRYQISSEEHYLNLLAEKNIVFKPICEFNYLALMSKNSPLNSKKYLDYSELSRYIEITHGDLTIPISPFSDVDKLGISNDKNKKIAVYERGSQFELLSRVPTTYMWVSPMPKDVLKRFSLVQKDCNLTKNKYKDVLIFKNGYHFTREDEMFLEKLQSSVNEVMNC